MEPELPYLPIADLVVGHVYRLRSRNLDAGAWDGVTFCGIRTKFDRRYLDTEDHWDESRGSGKLLGTAHPVEDLGPLPAGIEPHWNLGTACHATGRPILWGGGEGRRIPTGDGHDWVYADTREPVPAYPVSWAVTIENAALFATLLSLETAGVGA